MAHYIQKLIFLSIAILTLTGAAPRRPFSHKYHSTQVSACQNCHTDAEKSTKAEDNILPFNTSCVMCHDEVEIPEEPRKTPVSNFSHAQHTQANPGPILAAAIKSGAWVGPPDRKPEIDTKGACVACHHDITKSEAITPADGLAHYPRMADCMVCHSKTNPPESCKLCHDESKMTFRPASHSPEFSDAHAVKGKIDKTGCASCHGKTFTCKGCH